MNVNIVGWQICLEMVPRTNVELPPWPWQGHWRSLEFTPMFKNKCYKRYKRLIFVIKIFLLIITVIR